MGTSLCFIYSFVYFIYKLIKSNKIPLFFWVLLAVSFAMLALKIPYDNRSLLRGWLNVFASVKLFGGLLLWILHIWSQYYVNQK